VLDLFVVFEPQKPPGIPRWFCVFRQNTKKIFGITAASYAEDIKNRILRHISLPDLYSLSAATHTWLPSSSLSHCFLFLFHNLILYYNLSQIENTNSLQTG